MQYIYSGNVLRVGDNIDTDVIYPGRFLELVEPEQIGSHCFAGLDERIAPGFVRGDIIVAGSNFGCGSSREHAVIALLQMGAGAVVAESFARIFFRNGINLGLPLIVCPGIGGCADTGERITVDLRSGRVSVRSAAGERRLTAQPLGEKALEILQAGGIKPLMKKRLAEREGE